MEPPTFHVAYSKPSPMSKPLLTSTPSQLVEPHSTLNSKAAVSTNQQGARSSIQMRNARPIRGNRPQVALQLPPSRGIHGNGASTRGASVGSSDGPSSLVSSHSPLSFIRGVASPSSSYAGGSFLSRINEESSDTLSPRKTRHQKRNQRGSRSVIDEQNELSELLRLTTASTPFHQNSKTRVNDSRKEKESPSLFQDAVHRESTGEGVAVDDQEALLNALADCDALSDASTISADMTVTVEFNGGNKSSEGGKKMLSQGAKKSQTLSDELASTEHVLTLAQDIANQRTGLPHQRRGDNLLYIHVHTMIRSHLLNSSAAYGSPTCIAVAPVFTSGHSCSKSDASTSTLKALITVAVGTSRGFVLLFDGNWKSIGRLTSDVNAPVQATSIASDCSTVACNVRQAFFFWSMDAHLSKVGRTFQPAYTSTETAFDEPLHVLQHMYGMPYGLLAVEAHTGAVHVLALLSVFGKPMFLYRLCLISSCISNPTTSVDTFPFPSWEFFRSQQELKKHVPSQKQAPPSPVYPPLYTLLKQQKESVEKSSFWSTSSSASDHLVVVANNQGVTLMRVCMNAPSLSYVILAMWDMPRFSKCPPLVHLFAFQENGNRNLGVLVSCEGALFVVEISKAGLYPNHFPPNSSLDVQNGSNPQSFVSSLRLRSMLPWDPNALIIGIWVVGNGSAVVLDRHHILTLVDAIANVTVEHHTLPHSEYFFDLPVNSLFGSRAGGGTISSGRHQAIPDCGVITCTPEYFFLSATLLTWQERIDSMIHHRRFAAALQYIRELMLDVGLAVNGWATEGSSKGEKERALSTYMEIVSLSFLENTLQQGRRILSFKEKSERIEKTVTTILSFCQHKQLQRVFWSKVMGFLREYHEAALDPVMLAIKNGITSGIVTSIPAVYLPRFVGTLLSTQYFGKISADGDLDRKEIVETLLLPLHGDLSALQKIAKEHHFRRLSIHITSYFEKKHIDALLFSVQEDCNALSSNSLESKSSSLSIQFLSRFFVGKTFAKSVEYPKANHDKTSEQMLSFIYTSSSMLNTLLELDALGCVEIMLNFICNSDRSRSWIESEISPPSHDSMRQANEHDEKRKVVYKLQPVRFALRMFVALIHVHPLADSIICDRGRYKEDDFLKLDLVTPLLYKIITSATDYPHSRALSIQQALLRMSSIVMRYTTSLTESDNKMLEQCNWCLFLPVLAQISILQYKNAESVVVRREIQQALSDYFRSPHLRCTSLHLWQIKCHAARMSRVAASICFRDGRYAEAIDYYLDTNSVLEDPTLSKDLFDILHKEMFSLSIGAEVVPLYLSTELVSNSDRINKLRCAVIDHVVPLRKVDHTALVSFYLRYQSKKEEGLLQSFGGSTQKLLAFLEQLIESKDDALRGNIQIQNQYIELLCIHSPDKVYPYLRDHDNDISYDRSVAIQCSRKHSVFAATVYLLTASNRLSEALNYTCSTIEKLLAQIKNGMNRTTERLSTKNICWGTDGKMNKNLATSIFLEISPQLLEVLHLGIEVGRAANEEGTWLRLIQLFDPASAAPETCSYHTAAVNFSESDATRAYRIVCDAGLALVMSGISHSLGSAPLFRLILQVVPSCRWAPSCPPVMSLLSEEVKMYQNATSIAEIDALKWTSEFIRCSRRGVKSGNSHPQNTMQVSSMTDPNVCGACGRALQHRENGLLVDNVICLYSCGHGYHEECTTEPIGGNANYYTIRCPVCVKSCIAKEPVSIILHGGNAKNDANEYAQANAIETQYSNVKRVRGLLDSSGERTSALRNIISVLPAPKKSRIPRTTQYASSNVNRGSSSQREDEIGNVLFGMSSEEILRLFGSA